MKNELYLKAYKEGKKYLENYAHLNGIECYEIVEDSQEYPYGLLLINYDNCKEDFLAEKDCDGIAEKCINLEKFMPKRYFVYGYSVRVYSGSVNDDVEIWVKIKTDGKAKSLYAYISLCDVDDDEHMYWALTRNNTEQNISDDEWAENVINEIKDNFEHYDELRINSYENEDENYVLRDSVL